MARKTKGMKLKAPSAGTVGAIAGIGIFAGLIYYAYTRRSAITSRVFGAADAALGSGSDSAPEGQAEPGFENVGSEQPNAPFGPQQPGGSSGRTPPKNSLIQFITNLRNDPPAAAAPSPGAQARADQFNSVFTNLRATPTRDNRLAVQGSRGGHSVVFSGRPSAVNNIYFSARNNPRPSLKTLESQAAQDARLAATRARLRAETPAERQRRQSAGAAYRAALAAANARRGL